MDSTFDDLCAVIIASGLADHTTIVGCTDAEIALLEMRVGVSLPAAYKAFLRKMGKCVGNCFRGDDILVDRVAILETLFTDYLVENEKLSWMPENRVFPFFSHQGYEFLFFRLSDGDNPTVFNIGDEIRGIGLYEWTFTEAIRQLVFNSIQDAKKIGKSAS